MRCAGLHRLRGAAMKGIGCRASKGNKAMASTDKVAIVEGGGGIGRAAAIAFLLDGWSVAIGGRREDTLAATLELAGRDASRGRHVPGDPPITARRIPGAARGLGAGNRDAWTGKQRGCPHSRSPSVCRRRPLPTTWRRYFWMLLMYSISAKTRDRTNASVSYILK